MDYLNYNLHVNIELSDICACHTLKSGKSNGKT